MPKIAVYKNLIFFYVSFDINERRHLHIVNKRSYKHSAKIWIDDCSVFEKGSLNKEELSLARKLILANRLEIEHEIDNFIHGEKTKLLKLKLK